MDATIKNLEALKEYAAQSRGWALRRAQERRDEAEKADQEVAAREREIAEYDCAISVLRAHQAATRKQAVEPDRG